MSAKREQQIVGAFVGLATSLAEGFDVVDLLSGLTASCAQLLDVASAGLLLADTSGVLHLLAASSEATRDLELYQLQRAEGPCLDCYHSGEPVMIADLAKETARWPQFTAAATSAGFLAVHAVPMRLTDQVLGALNLFSTRTGDLSVEDLNLAQALAHVATVALVQDRAASDTDLVVSQLNSALSSRVVLEQAKGVLAEVGGLSMEAAFDALRQYSRDHNQRLTEVAKALMTRTLLAREVLDGVGSRGGSGSQVGRRPATQPAER
jgi:transcriptional regulator with GAF, ATPase, and Fis domain